MRTSRWLVLLLLTLPLVTGWAPAPQEETIEVAGQVTNGTAGGPIPADLPVTLHVFSGVEEIGAYTTTLTSDGSFHFDDLTASEGDILAARIVYQGVVYVSDFAAFEPGQQELSLPMAIYETTEDPSFIVVTQLHFFISVVEGRLQVEEYYLVSNTGDRTYVGVEDEETAQRVTLPFVLPDGARGLWLESLDLEGRYLYQEWGFYDTEPVLPGVATIEVSFSYELPYWKGFQVERAFDVPVNSVVLVLQGEDVALEGAGLTPAGLLDTQMGPVPSYTAGPLAVGETLAFALVGQAQAAVSSAPAGSPPVRNTAYEAAIGLVALALAVAVVYLLWRSSAPGPVPTRARPLVEAIAALDADFEAGQVTEKAYRHKRDALRRQLHALLADRCDD